MCRLRLKLKSAFTSLKSWCRVFENRWTWEQNEAICNSYLRSKWQSFLFSSRDPSQSSWYPYVCISTLWQAKLWKKNKRKWISLFPGFQAVRITRFGRERFGRQFYFRLPNRHVAFYPLRYLSLLIPRPSKLKKVLRLPSPRQAIYTRGWRERQFETEASC